MTQLRPTSDHDRARLKAAAGRAVERAGGGTAFSAQTRVEPAALSRYKADHEEHFMPLDVAVDADLAAGAPVILAAMASIEGFALVPVAGAAPRLCGGMVGRLIRETGDVSAAVLEAMADGGLTPAECKAIEKEIDEALAAFWQLRAAVRAG